MNNKTVWGFLGLILGVIIGIFAVSTTPGQSQAISFPSQKKASTMHDSMMESTESLSALEDAQFEQAFLSEMIDHHQGAVDMAKLVLSKSPRPELKAFAESIIAAQMNEIIQMEKWRSEWTR